MKKILAALMATVMMVFMCAGCAVKPNADQTKELNGYVDSVKASWTEQKALLEELKAMGNDVDATITSGDSSVETFEKQIKDVIEKGNASKEDLEKSIANAKESADTFAKNLEEQKAVVEQAKGNTETNDDTTGEDGADEE